MFIGPIVLLVVVPAVQTLLVREAVTPLAPPAPPPQEA
jgi:hypothetical protein